MSPEFDLQDFNSTTFPETMFNDNPRDPFENLDTHRSIKKVVIEPNFCDDVEIGGVD